MVINTYVLLYHPSFIFLKELMRGAAPALNPFKCNSAHHEGQILADLG